MGPGDQGCGFPGRVVNPVRSTDAPIQIFLDMDKVTLVLVKGSRLPARKEPTHVLSISVESMPSWARETPTTGASPRGRPTTNFQEMDIAR